MNVQLARSLEECRLPLLDRSQIDTLGLGTLGGDRARHLDALPPLLPAPPVRRGVVHPGVAPRAHDVTSPRRTPTLSSAIPSLGCAQPAER